MHGIYKTHIEPFLLGGMPMLFAPSFWVDPDTNVSTSSGLVTQLVDRAGGYTGTAPTEAKRPQLVQGGLNGYPVLRFAGGQVLDFGASAFNMSATKSRYAFAVVKIDSQTGAIYSKSLSASGLCRVSLRRGDTGGNTFVNSLYQDSSGTRQAVASSAVLSSGFDIISHELNMETGNNRLYVGTTMHSDVTIVPGSGRATSFRTLVGAYNNVNDTGENLFLTGDLAELVGYDLDTPMTGEQVLYEINRLKRKYNI
jgi:hypothetical protein